MDSDAGTTVSWTGSTGAGAGAGSGSSGWAGATTGSGTGTGWGSGSTGTGSGAGAGAGSGSGIGSGAGAGSGSGTGAGAGSSTGLGAGFGSGSRCVFWKIVLLITISWARSSSSSSERSCLRPVFSRISFSLISTFSAAFSISRSLPNCLETAGIYSSDTFRFGLASSIPAPCLFRKSTRSCRPILYCLMILLNLISAIFTPLIMILFSLQTRPAGCASHPRRSHPRDLPAWRYPRERGPGHSWRCRSRWTRGGR